MTTFDTPQPIAATINLTVGSVYIAASERGDTAVEVRPSRPSRRADITAAEETQVEFADGRLRVVQPRRWRSFGWFGDGGSVDVQIGLPAGSELSGEVAAGSWRSTGPLGACRLKAGAGDIELDGAGPVQLRSGSGTVAVRHVTGTAELTTGSGTVRADTVDGPAVVRNSHGESSIGDVTGELRVQAGNGSVRVGRAGAGVAVKSGYGDVQIGAVRQGVVVASSGYGSIDVGVAEGVTAWLDLSTGYGDVMNELDPSGRPVSGDATVEVRARTGFGDVTVRRAPAAVVGGAQL